MNQTGRPGGRPVLLSAQETEDLNLRGTILVSKKKPTRVYLQSEQGVFSRLFWVRNNKANEMILGFYALDGGRATITHEFPENVQPRDAAGPLTFKYSDATPVSTPVDHFTCHGDGRFHAKIRHGPTLYAHIEKRGEAIGRLSSPFLDSDGRFRSHGALCWNPSRTQASACLVQGATPIFNGARLHFLWSELSARASGANVDGSKPPNIRRET